MWQRLYFRVKRHSRVSTLTNQRRLWICLLNPCDWDGIFLSLPIILLHISSNKSLVSPLYHDLSRDIQTTITWCSVMSTFFFPRCVPGMLDLFYFQFRISLYESLLFSSVSLLYFIHEFIHRDKKKQANYCCKKSCIQISFALQYWETNK